MPVLEHRIPVKLWERDLILAPGEDDGVWRLLIGARFLIARGWVQGTFRIGSGFCLVGAMRECMNSLADFAAAMPLLGPEISGPFSLARWNDAPGRTQEEVLALLDRALATLEEGRRR